MSGDRFNEYCEALLVRYNRRNTETVTSRLENLCRFLRQEGSHVVQTMFGGSVRRGTYVTGLSDVDVLLIVNESSLVNQPPSGVIAYVRDTIQERLPQNPVRTGDLAVTVGYSDGTEIQILPAIRKNSGVRIAEPGSTTWSNVAHPERFAEKLGEVNQLNDGRVVPTIKLAKAIADCFITDESRKIAGYHMESLAIEAFSDYEGPLDPKAMLVHLLGHSMDAVMSPIADSTGQSRYVDEYLGPADSNLRERASTYFGQMRGKVSSCKTKKGFDDLFCEGN
jgi:hypothetical protein